MQFVGRSSRADGYSGADCSALLREAGLGVLRDDTLVRRGFRAPTPTQDGEKKGEESPLQIEAKHFDYAFDHVMPSVSKRDQARYDRMRERMARARSRAESVADAEEGGADSGSPAKPKEASDRKKL